MTIGKAGILWKLDRSNGRFLDYKETVLQNVSVHIDPKTGVPTYRDDIINAKTGEWIQSCPSAEGGHNWTATSYYPPSDLLIIPLSQSCNELNGHDVDRKTVQEVWQRPCGSMRCRAATAIWVSLPPMTPKT